MYSKSMLNTCGVYVFEISYCIVVISDSKYVVFMQSEILICSVPKLRIITDMQGSSGRFVIFICMLLLYDPVFIYFVGSDK